MVFRAAAAVIGGRWSGGSHGFGCGLRPWMREEQLSGRQLWPDNLDPFEISIKHYLRPFLVIWTIFDNFGQKMTQMVNIFKNKLHF